MSDKKGPVAVSIDIGFGRVSITKSIGSEIDIVTFTSHAYPVDLSKYNKLSGRVLHQKDNVIVDVDGISYEVGPHLDAFMSDYESRTTTEDYVDSPRYKALFLAALSMQPEDTIDFLVGGLPVNNMKKESRLIDFMTGEHKVNGRVITVRNAIVVAQPLGILYHHAFNEAKQENILPSQWLKGKRILTLDAGYSTFDWLFTIGMLPDENRSDAKPLGAYRIYSDVATALQSPAIFDGAVHVDLVDEALKNGSFKLFGESYDFPTNRIRKPFFDIQPRIAHVAHEALAAVKSQIRDGGGIDLILLGGGPIDNYQEAVRESYPKNKIEKVVNADDAVCRGLALIASQVAKSAAINSK
ncbi:hypothetical protein [Enterovibrio norvegicus]|uniref:ParM/StbA family protein n=1 Tax=Enterovibrio norvegicus TaxID=188144 RepID=UPI00352F2A82